MGVLFCLALPALAARVTCRRSWAPDSSPSCNTLNPGLADSEGPMELTDVPPPQSKLPDQ